jgi:hypothetical protein
MDILASSSHDPGQLEPQYNVLDRNASHTEDRVEARLAPKLLPIRYAPSWSHDLSSPLPLLWGDQKASGAVGVELRQAR